MLISLLFKEDGPENSVLLYIDLDAISKPEQTLPFTALKTKWKMDINLMVFAASALLGIVLPACPSAQSWPTLGTIFLVADSVSYG